ncbi:unnamed protein product, partial [Mesorhabditis belari]|uniref:RING-type domain-containing protein n=1 Tax=Mesorhabditis belari TaxID=2138241 RepID=A0AAF3J5P9_9BILA
MCDEEYSSAIGEKRSFLLHCNHTICTGCYLKARQPTTSAQRPTTSAQRPTTSAQRPTTNAQRPTTNAQRPTTNARQPTANAQRPKPDTFKQKITCPTCMKSSFFKSENKKNQFQDFMNELPKMTRQLEATRNALGCEECHEKFIADVMFHCSQCVSQICGACAYLKHRLHKANRLLRKRASDMMLQHWVDSSSAIKSCDKMLDQLNEQLSEEINSFGLKLLSKTYTYKNALTFSNLYENHEELTKLRTDFEASVEEYLPHLHNFGTKVKELIQAVDKKPGDDPIA